MKLLLIQPAQTGTADRDLTEKRGWTLVRPLSLFYLASAVRQRTKHQVEILDLELSRHHQSSDALSTTLRRLAPDVVGVTATTMTRFEAARLISDVREALPECGLIAGGVHFGPTDLDAMHHLPALDAIVRGEGEIPLVEYLGRRDRRESLDGVPSLTWRRGAEVVRNPDGMAVENLDELAPYDDFDLQDYPEYVMGCGEQRIPALSVMASRGCPYRCVFCAKAGMGYRTRDPGCVVREIVELKRRFGISGVNFLDLTFTASPKQVEALCGEILRSRVEVQWWCEVRANMDLRLLELMRAAGCVAIAVGVESGSPRILREISKGITLDQVHALADRARQLGLKTTVYLMYSHPNETWDDVQQTIRLAGEVEQKGHATAIQPTMILPGTGIEELARGSGQLGADFSWFAPFRSAMSEELVGMPHMQLFMDRLTPEQMRAVPALAAAERDQASIRAETARGLWRRAWGGVARHWTRPGYIAERARAFVRARL